jgi:signal transduction histidine kinase
VDIAGIINSAIESIRAPVQVKSINLESYLEPGKNWVLGDPNRLQQIVWNLLSNAVKFTPIGGEVKVRAHSTDADIKIIVSDSGVGIRPDFLPHVFETFSQAASASDRKYGGLGLGLSIVRHLVELHGGTVKARKSWRSARRHTYSDAPCPSSS